MKSVAERTAIGSAPELESVLRVSLFRPARTVTGPSGDYWELYVSKTAVPAWKEGRAADGDPDTYLDLLELPFAIVNAIWSGILVPLFRFAALFPVAVVKGRRSRAVRIEAINDFPRREVLLWTTTDGLVEGVLDEIVEGLAAGKVVQPVGAVYSGATGS
jgi:hypothetical protein